jgi:peptide/nickel transport system ATP-binding protein/oligopeptide transport system ATP-binding protein
MADNLLSVRDLKTYFHTQHGTARAVDGVSFSLGREETLGIVGESGSGKSVTMLSIMRLIYPPGKIESGRINFDGRDLMKLSLSEMRDIRGNKISMIFQEPMTSLNPLFRIGEQVSEAIRLHQGLGKKDALERSVEMLKQVGIPSPEKRVHDYPHQLSGGMRQRAMIAMAMSCRPMLMIADEPTTALDVTIQAQILDVIQKLMEQTRMSMILITHNMGVVAETVQRVMVMYAGKAGHGHVCRQGHGNGAGGRSVRNTLPPLHRKPAQIHSRHRAEPYPQAAACDTGYRTRSHGPAVGVPIPRPLQ